MKKIILSLFILASFCASAQTDSTTLNLTLNLPVKGVVLFGAFKSEQPNWSDRKAPDVLAPLIGSGTQPDSIVQVTLKTGMWVEFINRLQSERYGMISTVARSILNNTGPAISGYTGLLAQINTKATGNTNQQPAAAYVLGKYNTYNQVLTDLYNQYYQSGLNWIRN